MAEKKMSITDFPTVAIEGGQPVKLVVDYHPEVGEVVRLVPELPFYVEFYGGREGEALMGFDAYPLGPMIKVGLYGQDGFTRSRLLPRKAAVAKFVEGAPCS